VEQLSYAECAEVLRHARGHRDVAREPRTRGAARLLDGSVRPEPARPELRRVV
jgi:hypothetical protein